MDIAGGLAGGTMMTVASQTLLAATGQTMSESPSAIVIGSGPSGIAMAYELKHKLAFEDFTVYEKLDVVGGTWANNPYPGCGCDEPTHLYDFSFNLNPNWSKDRCEREEVLQYIHATVDKFDLRPHIHTSVELVKAQWQEKTNSWSLVLKDLKTGVNFTRYATIFILAAGSIGDPYSIELEGMNKFQGEIINASKLPSTWKESTLESIREKRVAIVGDGCPIEHLIPELAKKAAHVRQYTKVPQLYHADQNDSVGSLRKALYRYLPLYQRLYRLRLFLENDYLLMTYLSDAITAKALEKPEARIQNFEVFLEDIQKITENDVVTTNGVHDNFDTIVLASSSGAPLPQPPVEIIGSHDGDSLSQYWQETRGAQAYWGSLVSGFPNFGILYGPNTFPSHATALFASEVSVAYVSRVLVAPILDNRAATVTVRRAVEDRWNQVLQARLRANADEGSADVNKYGRDVVNWPGRASNFWLQTWLKGNVGVVYKGGGGAWWINMVARWVRAVRMRTWLALLLFLVSLRVRAVRARVDREVGRYKPIERQVEGYLAPLAPLRDSISKIVFKA